MVHKQTVGQAATFGALCGQVRGAKRMLREDLHDAVDAKPLDGIPGAGLA
jgi:hypothetical protein